MDWMLLIYSWDSLSITDQCCLNCKKRSVFGQIPVREKGLQYCFHGHTVICIMTLMNNPSRTIWEKKPPNPPSDACWLCLFTTVRLMREQYGGGWMDTCYTLTVKIADISWRRTNSKSRPKSRRLRKLSGMQIQKHFITCFFPAILCLRDWTKCLIKPKTKPCLREERRHLCSQKMTRPRVRSELTVLYKSVLWSHTVFL